MGTLSYDVIKSPSCGTMNMKVILDDGEQKGVEVPASVLEAKAPKDSVSFGTRFALAQWLKKKESANPPMDARL